MSTTTRDLTGERVTFRELFRRHPRTKVPLIQRDYAQGRENAQGIRREFVHALAAALRPEPELARPLDLDFVYGSIVAEAEETFLPLDGQQRLTTLFLLHWYAAWRDGRQTDFTDWISDANRSRLCYAVRTSSEEFFDQLVVYYPPAPPLPRDLILSKVIEDEPWFFRGWKLDPTVQGVLTMLDQIDAEFSGHENVYRLLTESRPPRITFQLLDLGEVGLSDDLYIKMNARGKPLTPFENFKARLEPLVRERFPQETRPMEGRSVPLQEYFAYRFDGRWADLFWPFRDRETNLFDDKVMRLFRALILVTRDPDARRVIEDLRNPEIEFSFFRYQSDGCLDEKFLQTLVATLDRWADEKGGLRTWLAREIGLDEEALFSEILERGSDARFESLVRLHAYSAYFYAHVTEIDSAHFGEWMRVVVNLSENTEYRSIEDFRRSVRAVNALLPHADRVREHLARPDFQVDGFDLQQVREEQLKAQLMERAVWRAAILAAERHRWFMGQIEFLLCFSGVLGKWTASKTVEWTAEEDAEFLSRFAYYFERADAMFGAVGLRELPEFLWERALLSIGDYLLPKGSSGYNWSFLENNKQREASWKRLLQGGAPASDGETKRQRLKLLWDKVDPQSVEASLRRLISQALLDAGTIDAWRLRLIEEPRHLAYCRKRISQWPANRRVYLFSAANRNGYFVELFSYHLRWHLLAELMKDGLLAPFDALDYRPVWGKTAEPYALLSWHTSGKTVELRIETTEQGYRFKLSERSGSLPPEVTQALPQLVGSGWTQANGDEELLREIEADRVSPEHLDVEPQVRTTLISLAAALNVVRADASPQAGTAQNG